MKNTKYGVRELQRDFGTEEACLDFLFDALHSRDCSCGGKYKRIKGRRQYQCSKCRAQIAPAAGTIFHKSDTPLPVWFHAIWVFSNAKSGVSAKQIERELNVTYKTAWRILMLIRKALPQSKDFLDGDVEVDEMYVGGRLPGGYQNRNKGKTMVNKSVVIGAVQRKGTTRAKVSPNAKAYTIGRFLDENINPITSRILTDNSNRYNTVARGYDRFSVNHSEKEYARGDVHTNTIEAFWGHFKRSIAGVNKTISKKYLPFYLDGFVWHANNRHNDSARFSSLLGALLSASN